MSTIVVPDEALLGAVVEQVWTSMLHQPVLPWLDPWSTGRAGMTAQIAVSGDWTGTLRLWCGDSAAVSMTRALLSVTAGTDPDLDETEDALGELVNVIAGSLKGALAGASALGLPRVTAGPPPDQTDGAVHLTVSWHGDPVLISIVPAG